jgi:hypothetical protein
VPTPRASAPDDEPLRVRSAAKRHSRGLLAPPAPALPSMTTRVSPPFALALPLAGGTPKPAAALLPASPAADALAKGQHRRRRAAGDSAPQAPSACAFWLLRALLG